MSSWDYDRIVHAQNAWASARRKNPPKPPVDDAHKPPPLMEGSGPQFVKAE